MTKWRPSSGPETAARRAAMLDRARQYFVEQGLLAVDTPVLSGTAVTDPNIESLSVRAHGGEESFLHTSPEFRMKRLLADGYPDCYSICRVFRDAEVGRHHAREFTMIEWYRLGFDLPRIIDDTIAVISTCLDNPSLTGDVVQYDFFDAFREFADIDIFTSAIDEFARLASADERLRGELADDRDAWIDLVLTTVIIPEFPGDRLTVLRHFPSSQAALARLCPDDDRVADRFEILFGALELANGYVELTDATAQRARMERDLVLRRRRGQRQHPPDPMLLGALQSGLPECAGVAVGVERLQMLLDQTNDIRDVMTFSTE